MPKAAFTTLGCKVNQYETQKILESFERRGFQVVPFEEPADVYVINTCSVTQSAEAKSRQTVRRASRQANAIVVMTGCYAQFTLRRQETLEEAHLVVPNPDKLQTLDYLLNAYPELNDRLLREPAPLRSRPPGRRARAVLKIQDGCNVHCAFCSIPYTRPVMRSLPVSDVMAEARALVEQGYRELVLTGVLIGDYGPHSGSEGPDLAKLCELISEIEGLHRIRISSIEPTLISDRLIQQIESNPKMCPHLHIPLQSGDARILERMNRPYNPAFYLELCRQLKERIPRFAISTDIMVGFPGEDEEAFQNTCSVVEQVGYCRAHLFRFSPRPGTPAFAMDAHVQDSVKSERSQRLQQLCRKVQMRYAAQFIGQEERVLIETKSKQTGLLTGTSDHYLQVECPGSEEMMGQFVRVKITEVTPEGVLGEMTRLED